MSTNELNGAEHDSELSIEKLGIEYGKLPVERQIELFRTYFQNVFDQREALNHEELLREISFLDLLGTELIRSAKLLQDTVLTNSKEAFIAIRDLHELSTNIGTPHFHVLSSTLQPSLHALTTLNAFEKVVDNFLLEYQNNNLNDYQSENIESTMRSVNTRRQEYFSFLSLMESMYESAEELIRNGEDIHKTASGYTQYMEERFGEEHRNSFKASITPIINNDIRYTGFIESIISDIPSGKIKSESIEKEEATMTEEDFDFDEISLKNFAQKLINISQENVQELSKGGGNIFEITSHFYGFVGSKMLELKNFSKENVIDQIKKIDPRRAGDSESDFRKIVEQLSASNENLRDVFGKNIAKIQEVTLQNIKPRNDKDESNYSLDERKQRAIIGEMFGLILGKLEELEATLADLGIGKDSNSQGVERISLNEDIDTLVEDMLPFIKELSMLRFKMQNGDESGKRKKKKVEKDGEEDNHAYSVTTGEGLFGPGGLELARVATHDTSYQDIIGASWRKVEEQVNDVIEYAKYQYIHLEMSPRKKMQGNFMIIGPYGCGKNEFMKALVSDERTIGVQMTTDRILSMMFGEFERNVRKLFELSEAKHHEHGKPVIIGWDEMDSMFPGDAIQTTSGSSPYTQAQKILQSVLDGDTPFEGTFLCGVTNEPQKIPVPIYRRFRTVQLIDKLTGSERKQLMMNFINGLPLENDFHNKVDWDFFESKTDNASGEILGKIADKVFKNYMTEFENKRPQRLKNINDEIGDIISKGNKLTPERRRNIFAKGNSPVVSSIMFMSAINSVMGEDAIQHQLKQQVKFYNGVDKLLHDAFQGTT